uniref:Uncharacterized protein n=1 Tax=Trypanosoma vivax (strain Y486) TaxID=1055687 RepID=G0U7P1_TRYVY|nr:hypothetical protein TVY486_1009440 [Trypanosoma vivax Y486]
MDIVPNPIHHFKFVPLFVSVKGTEGNRARVLSLQSLVSTYPIKVSSYCVRICDCEGDKIYLISALPIFMVIFLSHFLHVALNIHTFFILYQLSALLDSVIRWRWK